MNKKLGIALAFIITSCYSIAQVPFFQNYSLLKRREVVHVNVIFQDKAGFLWYGTNSGLFKFDGINLTQFDVNDSLPDSHVTAIGQDIYGRIWTGHRNGRLAYIEGSKVSRFDPQEGSSPNEISDILFDSHGHLWFSTLNDGLYYYVDERLFRLDNSDGMPDLFVYDLMEDPRGNIWAGTDGGVAICTLKDTKVSIRVLDYEHGLPDNIVKKMIMSKDNSVWMGTEDAGVVLYNPSTGRTAPLVAKGWNFGALTDFLIVGDQFWISSMQSGLVVYNTITQQSKVYSSDNGIDFKSTNTMLVDFEGNIWIGSKSGVVRTLGDQVDYIQSFSPYKNTNVLALTSDHENDLWFSTGDGLFRQVIDESGKTVLERPLAGTQFEKYIAISLYTDSEGYIWAGLYGEGVIRIDPYSRKTKYLNKELRNGNVLSIAGSGKVVWLATLGGATRIEFSGDDLQVENFGRNEGLASDYIYQVFMDKKGRVWFATDGKGAGMLDASGFHQYEKGLSTKVVYGFAEDSKNNIWINVQGDGLYKFNGNGFTPLRAGTPLRDKNVNCFSADRFGNLIIMHDLGIDIYDTQRGKIHYLGDEVGIRDKRPNLNALTTDATGRIYVGTDRGIVRYSDVSNESLPLARPLIMSMKVLDQDIDLAGDLNFSYDKNSVTIRYLGFWYQNPEGLNYQYKLDHYDRDWIASQDRSTTYSSLPPGEYTFHLRVSDTEDFNGAAETTLNFVIKPPFWKTVWFYVFAIAAVVVGASSFVQYRERKLVSDNRRLEEKVFERTLEIQKQAEEIQSQNQEIQSQAEEIQGINDNLEMLVMERTKELEKKNKASEEAAFIIAHELRAPVASVLGLINLISKCKLTDETQTIVTHLEDSADRLDVVVRNITKAIERGDK